MEKKTEMVHIRITPRYKRYLEDLAKENGFSIGGYVIKLLDDQMRIRIIKLAGAGAMADAILETNFPEFKIFDSWKKVKGHLNKPEDIQELLSKEDYEKFCNSWAHSLDKNAEKVAEEFNFDYDYVIRSEDE